MVVALVVVVELLVEVVVELLVELEDELLEVGRVADVLGEPSDSSEGTAVAGLGTPTMPVLETLGCARPAGPEPIARRMFSVTRRMRQRMVEDLVMATPQLTSSSSGDHPNVPALNTPAPLGTVYQVESA